MEHRTDRCAAAAAATCAVCLGLMARISAQDVQPRAREPIVLSWSVETAGDRDSAPADGTSAASAPTAGYSDLTANLRLHRIVRHVEFTVAGGGVARYQLRGGQTSALKDSAEVSAATSSRGRTTLKFDVSRVASPYALLPILGPTSIQTGDLATNSTDQLLERRTVNYHANAAATVRVGRRLTVGGEYDLATSADPDATSAFRAARVAMHASEQLGKSWAAVETVAYRSGSGLGLGGATVGDVETTGGLEYRGRALHGFRIGGGAGSAATGAGENSRRQATGFAHAERAIARHWTVQAAVQRAIEFSPLFLQPMLASSASGTVTGALSRRADVEVFGGFWTGAGADASTGFRSYRGGARLRVAVAPHLAVYGEYLRLSYRGGTLADARIVPSLPLERIGVRLGLSSTLPLSR